MLEGTYRTHVACPERGGHPGCGHRQRAPVQLPALHCSGSCEWSRNTEVTQSWGAWSWALGSAMRTGLRPEVHLLWRSPSREQAGTVPGKRGCDPRALLGQAGRSVKARKEHCLEG